VIGWLTLFLELLTQFHIALFQGRALAIRINIYPFALGQGEAQVTISSVKKMRSIFSVN
jgi:hypothetical protein